MRAYAEGLAELPALVIGEAFRLWGVEHCLSNSVAVLQALIL